MFKVCDNTKIFHYTFWFWPNFTILAKTFKLKSFEEFHLFTNLINFSLSEIKGSGVSSLAMRLNFQS